MTSVATRHFGTVFDQNASDYDKHRPGYPEVLIDQACQIADLVSCDSVLEVGCGSGQLTGDLVARGLRVTAIEPGQKLIAIAGQNVAESGSVEFINARFEEAVLPKKKYKAVFSASAFHWVDPDISWQKVADVLAPGGVFGLMQYFGLREVRSSQDLDLQLAAIKKVAPAIAESWPTYYEIDEVIDGVGKRREDISEVWAWLGNYDLARSYVAKLFDEVQVAAVPTLIEQTADQLIALFRTTSPYGRLSGKQRTALEQEFREMYRKLGRPIRSSTVNILITAKRK